jgi:hypothetical protein
MKFFALLLLFSMPVAGQTIAWVDDSASDSPLTYKGTISFDPSNRDNIACSLTGHNYADKTVVALVIHLTVVRPDGHSVMYRHRHDHFFKDQTMMAATSPQPRVDFVPNDIDCGTFGGQSLGKGPATPSAHAKTMFVQFDDGSTWSGPEAASDEAYVMFQRAEALKYLQSLKSAYVQGGVTSLTQVLAADPGKWEADHKPRPEVRSKYTELHLLNNNAAIVNQIDSYLANAQARANWMIDAPQTSR